jgi:hypothetical protein
MTILIIAFTCFACVYVYLFATLEKRIQKQWYEQYKDELNESIKWRTQYENKQYRKTVLF